MLRTRTVLLSSLLIIACVSGLVVFVEGQGKKYDGVYFPLGDRSFADQASLQAGKGTGSPANDASKAIGPPGGEDKYVSLGDGGVLTVKFVDNNLVDVDGPDLYVFEIGPKVEPFKVEISTDGSKWTSLGIVSGQPTSLDIHGSTPAGAKYSYVRITDANARMSSSPYAGADIAAIGAIGSEAVNVLDVTVSAEPAEGRPGDSVRLAMMVMYETASGDMQPVDDAVLSLKVKPSMGLSTWTKEEDTGIPGTYGGSFVVPVSAEPRVYTLTVTASKEGFEAGSASCTFTVKGANALDVTVSAAPAEGHPGDSFSLAVMVMYETTSADMEPVDDAFLSWEVKPSMGLSTWTKEDTGIPGTYSRSFVVPANAKPRVYTFTVTASKEGFEAGSASCTFTVKGANALVVTVSAAPAEGHPGDSVSLAVMVAYDAASGDAEFVDDAVLSLKITPSIGVSTIHVTEEDTGIPGTYSRSFVVPANAAPGVYTITVTASKEGFEAGSGSCSLIVKEADASGASAVTSVGGGLVGVGAGVGGPILVSKAASAIKGTNRATEKTTEQSERVSEEKIRFTDPHEEPESTYWEQEKDPEKRKKKREKESEAFRKRQKWLSGLSEEDRVAEDRRTMSGQSIQDEYIQMMNNRPDFMKRIDQQARAESLAKGPGHTPWGDEWIVGKVNDGDLRGMSAEERTQYDRWVKRYDSFTRRHGSNLPQLRTADGRYDRAEFSSTAGGGRDVGPSRDTLSRCLHCKRPLPVEAGFCPQCGRNQYPEQH